MLIAHRFHEFSYGHRVVGQGGKCEHLHGHNGVVTFHCTADGLDEVGRVIDFSCIKTTLCAWLEANWDHRFLVWEKDEWRDILTRLDEKATTKLPIKAIITDSFSGRMARNLAAFRGKYPVLAICYKEKTMRHLALSYGVEAIFMPEKANGQAYYFAALRKLLDDGVLTENDMVAYLSGGKQGTQTSFLEINVVGDVLKYAMDYVLPNRNRYL